MSRLSATIIIVALVHGGLLEAFQPQEEVKWEAVVVPDTAVRVVFLDGAVAEGAVVEITVDSVVLRQVRRISGRLVYEKRGKARVFNREHIVTIELVQPATQSAPVLVNVLVWVMAGVLAVAIVRYVADKVTSIPSGLESGQQ